jgi:hypothetical protein
MTEEPSHSPSIRLTMAVEFDQSVFHAIVSRFGVIGWNDWVGKLYDRNLTASVWLAGEYEPANVFFRFTEDLREQWPTADFTPVWFIADDEKKQEGMPELFVIPLEEVMLEGKVSVLVDRT